MVYTIQRLLRKSEWSVTRICVLLFKAQGTSVAYTFILISLIDSSELLEK